MEEVIARLQITMKDTNLVESVNSKESLSENGLRHTRWISSTSSSLAGQKLRQTLDHNGRTWPHGFEDETSLFSIYTFVLEVF